jgi:hypothetical protein
MKESDMLNKIDPGRVPLGRASRETRGASGFHMEAQGLWTKTGLSDR